MKNTEKKIADKITNAGKDSIFFTEDFRDYGTAESVKVALHRLVKRNILSSLARGIYAKPEYSKLLNMEVLPGVEKVAKAIARRDKARIIPTGSYALHALGLSTQVPMKIVYLTDATARKIKIRNTEIVFKRTTAKNLSYKSELCMLAVQALKEIGKNQLTEKEKHKVIELLKQEQYKKLKHDIAIAPQWIAEIMVKALPK